MKADYTHIVFVIDRSGSMATMQQDAQEAFNDFIKDQKKVPGKATITLAQFDSEYDVVWNGKSIKKVGKYTLEPRGSTALLDAVGKTINTTGQYLSKMAEKDRPKKVIFAVLTDGQENNSKEFSTEQIKEMIEHQKEKYSWEFNFLAANQDALTNAANIGMPTAGAMNFAATGAGVRSAMQCYSTSAVGYRNDSNARGINLDDLAPDTDSQKLKETSSKA